MHNVEFKLPTRAFFVQVKFRMYQSLPLQRIFCSKSESRSGRYKSENRNRGSRVFVASKIPVASQQRCVMLPVGNPLSGMREKTDVRQGTLALMVLKTLDVLGPLHGYGIARRIEQISGDLLTVNQGTLYPVLLKLEQEGSIVSEWGTSENNRKARFYRLTRDGRKHLQAETRGWEQTAAIMGRFFAVKAEDLP